MNNHISRGESALYYECGFSCDNALLLVIDEAKYFITDSRYTQEAKEFATGVEVVEARDLIAAARRLIRSSKVKRVIVDPNEWRYSDLFVLYTKLPSINFVEQPNFSQANRAIKRKDEIDLIKIAIQDNAVAFSNFAEYINNLSTSSIELELQYKAKEFLTNSGKNELSFEPIFAINENAAKPHALPTKKPLNRGDLILFDAGTKHNRYCSDRTRTAQFGSNGVVFEMEQRFTNPKMQQIYEIVLKAHDKAIAMARSGMMAKELDLIARQVISDAGYGRFFSHSLGHGIGLDIHEYPFINYRNDLILEDNMIFTIEPGIYLPNEFGVRIESVVMLDGGRATVL